jgi:hypothetical protein
MPNRRFVSLVVSCGLVFAVATAQAAIPVQQVSPSASGPVTFATTAVGSTSTQSVQLQLGVSSTISISVPASANGHQEFAVGTITGCAADGTTVVTANTTCTVPITFQPYYPGQRSQPLAVTVGGQVYSFGLTGMGTGPLARLDPTYVTTTAGAAGTTSTTASPDNVPILSSIVYAPEGLVADSSNNLYISDTSHARIRVAYQTANAQLACLIIAESPTTFGLAAGTNTCAGATSQPTVGDMYTIAGTGSTAYVADNVLASSAGINPTGVSVDAAGNVYIADEGNARIRVVYQGGANVACLIVTENPTLFGLTAGGNTCVGATSQPTPGFIYTIAGTGTSGYSGDAGLASAAKIYVPQQTAVDNAGDVFFTDYTASLTPSLPGRVRVIYNGGALAAQLITIENPSIASPIPGFVYTVAGNLTTEGGDGTLATSATAGMLTLYDMVVDQYDNVYVADKTYGSTGLPLAVNRIRVIYNGTAALPNPLASLIALENPSTVASASAVQPGYIYTVAGGAGTTATAAVTDGVLATQSQFAGIYGFALDAAGDIVIGDRLNYTLRRVSAATGLISTIAGAPSATQSITNGSAQAGQAKLWSPWGVTLDSAGGVYETDNGANRIRYLSSITSTTYPFVVPSTATQTVSGIAPFIETNIGTPGSTLTITADSATTPFGFMSPAAAPGVTECASTSTVTPTTPSITSAVSLAAGKSCSFGLAALPLNGGVTAGSATTTDNSLNATGSTHLMNATISATGVTTVVTASPTPITGGNPTVLTATLTNAAAASVTSGAVTFSITGGATLGTGTLNASGVATITTSGLVAPTTSVTTVYAGATTVDPSFTPSTSVTVFTVSAKPATSITLSANNTTLNLNQSVTFTATVSSPTSSGAFTGSVAFTDTQGSTVTTLATVPVNAGGVATYTTTALAAGTHTINAAYSNDLVYSNTSTTTSVKVVVTAPAYTASVASLGIAVQSGQDGVVPITISTVGGYSGTITASCGGGLPAGVTCNFNPSSVIFSGANNTQTMTLYITTSTMTGALRDARPFGTPGSLMAMMLWLPGSIAGLFGLRRRSALQRWQKMSLLVLVLCGGLIGMSSMMGCSGSTTSAPFGTFNVPVTVTDGTTATPITITVSVIGASSVK